jgi:ATP-dependent RNA helicase DeaD
MTAADRRRHPEYFAVSVGVGARNGVSVNMLVAVLARCLDIPGKALGRIEIRDNYSLIEVPTSIARELNTRLHGVELCGRFLSPRPAREVLERERTHHRVR